MEQQFTEIDHCANDEERIMDPEHEPLQRLRFWDGRFLVARDLRDQQHSFIRRTELHQRFSHGTGVACGYQVEDHPREECRGRWLVVSKGLAYACDGGALWMTEPRALELPDRDDPRFRGEDADVFEAFVVVRRHDRLVDPVPTLYAEDLCDPVRREYGRIQEDVKILVLPPGRISEDCWPREKPVTISDCDDPTPDDCCVPLGDVPPCNCECVCQEGVVIARLVEDESGDIAVDTTHRRLLAPPTDLTRITGVNWPHGGEVTLDDLRDDMSGSLVVRFSRPLKPVVETTTGVESVARGINRRTFTVSFLSPQGVVEYIMPPDLVDLQPDESPSPRLSDNRRCAVFDIPSGLLQGRTSIRNSTVFVTIRGDFVEDCHGRAISAAHILGDVAYRGTGNMVQGGLFESWFYVA